MSENNDAIIRTLHKREERTIFEPEEGQRNLLCSNKKFNRCPSFGIKSQALIDFAKSLKKIHIRLKAEGYVIKQGEIYKPK